MIELPTVIPDYATLLALEPEELGAKMLFLVRQRGDKTFHPGNAESEIWGDPSRGQVWSALQRVDSDQAADLTGGRACLSSNCCGLR
jgi:hypothetical protein